MTIAMMRRGIAVSGIAGVESEGRTPLATKRMAAYVIAAQKRSLIVLRFKVGQ